MSLTLRRVFLLMLAHRTRHFIRARVNRPVQIIPGVLRVNRRPARHEHRHLRAMFMPTARLLTTSRRTSHVNLPDISRIRVRARLVKLVPAIRVDRRRNVQVDPLRDHLHLVPRRRARRRRRATRLVRCRRTHVCASMRRRAEFRRERARRGRGRRQHDGRSLRWGGPMRRARVEARMRVRRCVRRATSAKRIVRCVRRAACGVRRAAGRVARSVVQLPSHWG
mmetsp:Transcript_1868/g.6935  ORF Transcript_1868/g.6935 Transcript_1868/m.6935 type:complete len:223 (-) Transcript_1868:3-671(-)